MGIYSKLRISSSGGGGPESDPIFNASAAAGITSGDITNWNNAVGWGNHASAGYLTTGLASTTYYPIPVGSTSQYLRGDGSLATFPTIPIVGTWGAINYPTWTAGSPFVKMTAAGVFSLDTNAYEQSFTTLPINKGGTNSAAALSNNRIIQSSGGAIVEASAITAARALKSDANGIPIHFDTTTEPSLAELSYVKGVASAIQTQIDGKEDKSTAAYTFHANNTNATANSTDQVFKSIAQQTYTGSITWTGTTAPSGTTNHSYIWQQVGNIVTLFIRLDYANASSATTSVLFDLPTDCPAPLQVTGVSGANNIHYRGNGTLVTNNLTNGVNLVAALKRNAANTAWEISLATSSGTHRVANATIQYRIN